MAVGLIRNKFDIWFSFLFFHMGTDQCLFYNYIRELRNGKAKDKDDMTLRITDDTRFYCYIIADPTEKLVKVLEDNSFSRTPDGDGYYFFHPFHKAYVEMISYRKLLEDAKKRNRILFDKLGIPS